MQNYFDPWRMIHKNPKKATLYMQKYYKSLDDYRKVYSDIIARKIKTPTEIKKLGLYIPEAFDRGSSAMGGGASVPITGIPDVFNIVPINTTGVANPSLEQSEHVVDATQQLTHIREDTVTRENRNAFKARVRQRARRAQQIEERRRLITELAKLADPENPNPVEFSEMTRDELIHSINYLRDNNAEVVDEKYPDEPIQDQRAESSEALYDIEMKRLDDESAYSGNERYQRIMKGEKAKFNKKKPTRNTAYWAVLQELIRSSLNNNEVPLVSMRGTETQDRSLMLQTAMTQIGNIEGAPQRMLDLLASFGIDLRDPNFKSSAKEAKKNVRKIQLQLTQLDIFNRNKLSLAFSKLFRTLVEEKLTDDTLTPSKRQDLERLLRDVSSEGAIEYDQTQITGVKKDKPLNANDMVEISNEDLLTNFRELLTEIGYDDSQINELYITLSNFGEDQTQAEYDKIMKDFPNTSIKDARIEAIVKTYDRMLQELVLYIDTLNNVIQSKIDTRSNLRNALVVFRIKEIIQHLIDESKKGIKMATIKFTLSDGLPSLISTYNNLTGVLDRLMRVFDSIKTPTTAGGVPIRPNQDDVEEKKYDRNNNYIPPPNQTPQTIRERYNVTDLDESRGAQLLRQLRRPGSNLVSFRIFGRRMAVGLTPTIIHWNGLTEMRIKGILFDYLSLQPKATTDAGISLSRSLFNQITRSHGAELYRLADTIIKNRSDRRNLLKKYPELRPPREVGDPPPDPDNPDGDGGLVVGINDGYRTLKISSIVAILSLIGTAIWKIIDLIENAKNGKSGSTEGTLPPDKQSQPPKGPSDPSIDPTNIGIGGDQNPPNNNIPSDNIPPNIPNQNNIPDLMFPNRGGNTDPIYGGIGNIAPRTQPFKPIGYPTLDDKLGADFIEADENMMKNSAIMKLVQKYNDDARRYNDILQLKYDLQETGEALTKDEELELTDLSSSMKNQISLVNQQAPLVPFLQQNIAGGGKYYGDSITISNNPKAFKTLQGKSISNIYTLIPTDDYTKSIGLNDDISTYNSLAETYNAIALKYKDYGQTYANEGIVYRDPASQQIKDTYLKQQSENPEYVKAIADTDKLDKQIQPLLSKINSVLSNPETSVGREFGRDVKYTDAQKSLITKVSNMDWNDLSTITEQEKQALRDSPELYPDFEKMMAIYNRLTDNGKTTFTSDSKKDPQFAEFIRLNQKFIDIKNSGFKYSSEKAPLAQTDWKLIQQDSQKEYVRSKQDFLDAVARLKNATASGLSSHQVSQLYNDLEAKRLHYETSRQTYEKMADSYKHSLSGRTSFLADMTQERLPDTPAQVEKFDRLQTIERILQNNPDALKEYNDMVIGVGIKSRTSIEQNYDLRTKIIEGLATKYNLVNEYTDASTRLIDVKIPSMAEDPNTIVDFQGEGSDDIGKSTERANFIDPSEATLFMSDQRDRALEQKRWEDFSLVQPWNGLGNPQTNPLLRHQVQEYITRYGKCDKAPKPTPMQLRQLEQYKSQIIKNREQQPNYKADFPFMPTVQASFGREIWENEFAIPTNNFKSQQAIFTREDNDLSDNQFNTWYPKTGSIYHPDRQIDSNNFDPSSTAKLRTNSSRRPVFEGLPNELNQQYGSQQVSQFGGETMNNNFGSNPKFLPQSFAKGEGQPINTPQRRPNSVFDNLDMSARRTMSMRR